MRKRTILLATSPTTGLLTALPATAATAAPAPGPTADFNGDGYGDVALAAPATAPATGPVTGPVTEGARTFGPGALGQTRSYGAFGAHLIG
ncbi:FG-GAP repeat protein [Streptomyces sp. NRRL S-475]|uniref:FG-GAP repeat protein n=1 Tax=Streptomyces sp. NRRL S-475 TaxID=1463910 RepID=UPI0004C70B04|nr:FG-GAP repeat protein [Streptomyces sp. NRRL S-475]